MNVVDSSGWLEYLAEGPNADFLLPAGDAQADSETHIAEYIINTLQKLLDEPS